MSNTVRVKILGALALGATLAMPVFAAQKDPVSVDESRPGIAGKEEKGKAGVSTIPSKGPASVDDSNPSRKPAPAPVGPASDSKNMPNPKTPSSVDESRPDLTGKSAPGYGEKGSLRKDRKDKDAMAK